MIPPHHLRANRAYHSRQRNKIFREVVRLCRRFRRLSTAELPTDESLAALQKLEETILLCAHHARAAIFGYTRNIIPSFSADPENGVLQEELLLVTILEEKLRSMDYLRTYLRTERELNKYISAIEKQKIPEAASGFIDQMIEHIQKSQQLSREEMSALIAVQGERSDLGESLLDRIDTLLPR